MSHLAHVCRRCTHLVGWHEPRARGYSVCGCCRTGEPDHDPEPTVFPTWSFPGGRLEPLARPGSVRNARSMHQSTTCDCRACVAAYLRLEVDQRAAG